MIYVVDLTPAFKTTKQSNYSRDPKDGESNKKFNLHVCFIIKYYKTLMRMSSIYIKTTLVGFGGVNKYFAFTYSLKVF